MGAPPRARAPARGEAQRRRRGQDPDPGRPRRRDGGRDAARRLRRRVAAQGVVRDPAEEARGGRDVATARDRPLEGGRRRPRAGARLLPPERARPRGARGAGPVTAAAGRDAPLLVTTPEELARLAERLSREPLVALDTEANSLHAFRERVCVVQASVPGLDAIVDPLAVTDLSPLRAVVAREDAEVVLHGGDYDVSILSRDHGFEFPRVFDTMIAATLLGEERVGLAALLEAGCGVRHS